MVNVLANVTRTVYCNTSACLEPWIRCRSLQQLIGNVIAVIAVIYVMKEPHHDQGRVAALRCLVTLS
jgi:hypothetical protein